MMREETNLVDANEFGPVDEYKTLREESLQAKKYVFERPLLIVALAVAGLRTLESEYVAVLPVIVAALLLFNFWFTVNRLSSAARIVAYIQLELESRSYGRWVGWETCLREYRKWLKRHPDRGKGQIRAKIDNDAVPDALMYYLPIYGLHIGLMLLTVSIATLLVVRDRSWVSGACALLALSLAGWFAWYLRRYRPKVVRTLIEDNRVIWNQVLDTMQHEGIKPS